MLPFDKAKPGEIVTFGVYPQTADGADKTPIRWRVLQAVGNELFLLSEFLLDSKRYHSDDVDTTWQDCDLRKWLNDGFYNRAFTDTEKECIKTTHCADNGEGKPDTHDRVFLLGVAEAKTLTGRLDKHVSIMERRAVGTDFAKAKKADGCRLYVYDKSVRDDYLTEDGTKLGCSWWWLRTQPDNSSRATFVGTRASIRSYGRVNLPYYGVRPALKVNLPR